MKKALSIILAVLMLAAVLAGCNGSSGTGTSSGGSSQELDPSKTTIAICMDTINHPVHRIAQMGFLNKADELGYNGVVAGLDEGSIQELIAKFESVITNGAKGAVVWSGDDNYYEMMRKLSEQCVFVVPHFAHEYADTKGFISKNISSLAAQYGREAAIFIVERLAEKNITSGVIGITQVGPNVTENAASDAFRAQITEMGVNFTCAPTVFEGLDPTEAINKVASVIQSQSGIVAGFGTTGGSPQSWALAMQSTGRTDLVAVGMDYTEINVGYVKNKQISAIVAAPLIEETSLSVVALDEILRGADYTTSKEDWFTSLEAPLAYIGGEGKHDIETYVPIIDQVREFYANQ